MEEKIELKLDKKKLLIDHDICIGCGSCEGIAPDYFKVSDGLATPTAKAYDEEDADLIEEAIDSCPVQAISLKTMLDTEDLDLADGITDLPKAA